jgi:arginase
MMRMAFLGAAFSAGGPDPGPRQGPRIFREQVLPKLRRTLHGRARWAGCVRQRHHRDQRYPEGLPLVADNVRKLAARTALLRRGGELPVVIGGDHSGAIGTWSGIASVQRQAIGLLWIDAHLDSHTPESSESQRIHGMPLAALLGEGDPALVNLAGFAPVVDARYCAIIGVRSFEAGEPLRLKRLGVRFYTRSEILRRGLNAVVTEAWQCVSACPAGFGISLDLDVLDPMQAPGVSVPERRGLHPRKLAAILARQGRKHRLRGVEMVELNPRLDTRGRTASTMPALLAALIQSAHHQSTTGG